MGNRYTSSTNDNGRSFLKPFPRPHAPPEFPDLLDWPDDVAGWLVDADDGGGLALPPALRQRLCGRSGGVGRGHSDRALFHARRRLRGSWRQAAPGASDAEHPVGAGRRALAGHHHGRRVDPDSAGARVRAGALQRRRDSRPPEHDHPAGGTRRPAAGHRPQFQRLQPGPCDRPGHWRPGDRPLRDRVVLRAERPELRGGAVGAAAHQAAGARDDEQCTA